MSLSWEWLGRVDHAACAERQRARRDAIIAGEAAEVVWCVEHPPTVTVGRRPAPGTPSPEALASLGIAFSRTERGGLATWHGPGQLVVYPLISLWDRRLKVKDYVYRLEQATIDWLGTLGVDGARRRCGFPGVWVASDKVAAVGIHIRRGVSLHGLAINLAPDLAGFGAIVPCGIHDGGVTSVERLCGVAPQVGAAAEEFAPLVANCLRPH